MSLLKRFEEILKKFTAFRNPVLCEYNKNDQYESCFTQERAPGECISIRSCPELANLLLERPLPSKSAEYLKKAQCGFIGLDAKVCCPLKPVETTPKIRIQTLPKFSKGSVTSALLPNTTECGTDTTLNKIVGADVADLFEFPWMGLIEYQTPAGYSYHCGSVLINNRYVLTAAHCIIGKAIPRDWTLANVVLGEYNTDTKRDCVAIDSNYVCSNDPLVIPVIEKIPHEYYDPFDKSQQHDIALLRLARTVTYNFVKPICLPTSSLLENTFSGTKGMVSGWGKTENKNESNLKLKLSLPIISNRNCEQIYGMYGVSITNNHICAGGEDGKDTCTGDSGGPLMNYIALNDINWYVTGIVSFGPTPCGLERWPGVYTRVTEYVPWIVSKLRP
ncbi:hypothetical protein FQR65_LT02002 [Abscondita terminalis]|nr:hypothetical protein FQR65_LT02002 [Abscondita terminalis]